MKISTHDFRMLAVLARERHFGRAADLLGLRQPQVSLRVAELEREIGAQLFNRRPHASLTQAGEIIVEAARSAAAEFEAAVALARRLGKGQAGSVVVAIASSVMLSDIPRSLDHFRRAWPDVDVALRDMHSAHQLDALLAGQIDISITREPGKGGSIRTEILGRQRFVVLLPKSHRLAALQSVTLAELAEEPFVLFASGVAPGLLEQIHQLCINAGFSPRIAQQAEEWYTVLGFVRAGFGITIALDIFGALAWSDVAVCQIEDDSANSPVYLCWDEARSNPTRDLLMDWIRRDAANTLEIA